MVRQHLKLPESYSSGRLLVGTSSTSLVGGSVGAKTQIEYAGGSGFNGLSVSATDGAATVYINNAASTAVASGALVGRLGFTGYDGTDTRNQFASIEMQTRRFLVTCPRPPSAGSDSEQRAPASTAREMLGLVELLVFLPAKLSFNTFTRRKH